MQGIAAWLPDVNMSGRGYYVIVCSWNVIVALSNAVYATILC